MLMYYQTMDLHKSLDNEPWHMGLWHEILLNICARKVKSRGTVRLALCYKSRLEIQIEFDIYIYRWLSGLGVWFALRVREVPGSNPGWALSIYVC